MDGLKILNWDIRDPLRLIDPSHRQRETETVKKLHAIALDVFCLEEVGFKKRPFIQELALEQRFTLIHYPPYHRDGRVVHQETRKRLEQNEFYPLASDPKFDTLIALRTNRFREINNCSTMIIDDSAKEPLDQRVDIAIASMIDNVTECKILVVAAHIRDIHATPSRSRIILDKIETIAKREKVDGVIAGCDWGSPIHPLGYDFYFTPFRSSHYQIIQPNNIFLTHYSQNEVHDFLALKGGVAQKIPDQSQETISAIVDQALSSPHLFHQPLLVLISFPQKSLSSYRGWLSFSSFT